MNSRAGVVFLTDPHGHAAVPPSSGQGSAFTFWRIQRDLSAAGCDDLLNHAMLILAILLLSCTSTLGQQIAAGQIHSCMITLNGTVRCWGCYSMLPPNPCQAPRIAGPPLVQVSAGATHSCALSSSGRAFCWGLFSAATPATFPIGEYQQIGSGSSFACALAMNGSVICVGQQAPPSQIGSFSVLSVGGGCACAIANATSRVSCWGFSCAATNTTVEQVRSVSVGAVACALTLNGSIVCWGCSSFSLLCEPPGGAFLSISVSANHGCAIKAGTIPQVACWGCEFYNAGQCNAPIRSSVAVLNIFPRFVQLSAGNYHTIAIDAGRQLAVWGCLSDSDHNYDFGQCALPSPIYKRISCCSSNYPCVAIGWDGSLAGWGYLTYPPQSAGGNDLTDVSCSSNPFQACALKVDGQVRCWGLLFGQGEQSPSPSLRFRQLSGSCGILANQSIYCWARLPKPPVGLLL